LVVVVVVTTTTTEKQALNIFMDKDEMDVDVDADGALSFLWGVHPIPLEIPPVWTHVHLSTYPYIRTHGIQKQSTMRIISFP
jgi:hypothetical protein